ncbi:DeoR family transcriptional regulator [Pseudarthrobacter oxydans]|uniref:DeoR family transcriptional regulator n=1 Tax=Pseudarthrobacter oxydans TaxID=1671 RepID=UPI00286D5697|nr:DeoR family transcriptional regulator [Pseudarthrobacter oxydans]
MPHSLRYPPRFEVTASTIRRDLALLTEQGRLARTYRGPWRWARTWRRRCGRAPARQSNNNTPSPGGRCP